MTTPAILLRQGLDQAAREDLLTFVGLTVRALKDNDQFEASWHHESIAYELQKVEQLGGQRLMINVPPRSLKSVMISVAWVAWMLGRDPRLKFICVSYSQELALKLARDCRAIMQTEWYQRIFPGTVLERAAENDLRTTAGGGRYSTSVGGTLTGLGGDIIVIDDPIKPDEAHSEAARNACGEWCSGVLSTRLDSKLRGSIVLVMQRVHQDDLAGRLLEVGGWNRLSLPAIAVQDETIPLLGGRLHHRKAGDLLHPAREDQAVLDRLRRDMGSLSFEAQYQQSPIPAEGALFKRRWFARFDAPLAPKPGDQIIQSWDCAVKAGISNDWSVCITAVRRGGQIYIVNVYRDRLEFPALKQKVIAHARYHGADVLLIEDASSGQQLCQALRAEAPNGVPRPIATKALADKEVRIMRPSAAVEAGEVALPNDAPWLGPFLEELLGFPRARHDDQVDALSQLLNWASPRPSDRPPCGPILIYQDEYGHIHTEGSFLDDCEEDAPAPTLPDLLYGFCWTSEK